MRQINAGDAAGNVFLVQKADAFEMRAQGRFQAFGQHHHTVLSSLPHER
jgi:hypothetical protein